MESLLWVTVSWLKPPSSFVNSIDSSGYMDVVEKCDLAAFIVNLPNGLPLFFLNMLPLIRAFENGRMILDLEVL